MISIKIDNTKLNLQKNITVLQACDYLNKNVPRFCFHENLSIAGNCRMCLVEIKNSPKPIASCALPIANGMEIFTSTPLVQKARESVLEFLLINHPLDCPVCDQGGECDLQDQTMKFGSDRSRFFFSKRSVENKNCGPFIKTIMTRCIHCTRCVRFANEVCGIDNLGTTGRGNHTEIAFYVSKIFESEYSGNVIDLCPVGALTSKPFSFKARPWELAKHESIDILDGLGSNIIVQTFNNKIVRVLPKDNKDTNIEWITNKTRFFFDSLKYQRISKPQLKSSTKYSSISWSQLFNTLTKTFKKVDSSKCKVIFGDFIDLTSYYWAKKTFNYLGIQNLDHVSPKCELDGDYPNKFIFNNRLVNFREADVCLLINCNTRAEGSVLNLHLRNSVRKNNLSVYSIGKTDDLTFPVTNLGLRLQTLTDIFLGKHEFCQILSQSKKCIIVVGVDTYQIEGIQLLLNSLGGKVNVLNNNMSFINFLEVIGKRELEKKKDLSLLFLYNTDVSDKKLDRMLGDKNVYIVYMGHHFTGNAQRANLIIPCSTFFEKKSSSLNILGAIQKVGAVLKNKDSIKSDVRFFKNLYLYMSKKANDKINFSKDSSLTNLYKHLKTNQLQLIDTDNLEQFENPAFTINKSTYFKVWSGSVFLRNNILEKFSKVLTHSLQIFKKPKNFIL
jgi:NADH-quinone oxidoreductase subunit G